MKTKAGEPGDRDVARLLDPFHTGLAAVQLDDRVVALPISANAQC